ncbi:MAG: hypothetical protein J6T15_05005 [Bacilli bacterium]|nr:hypothetical protein [Bacilli bacterium]
MRLNNEILSSLKKEKLRESMWKKSFGKKQKFIDDKPQQQIQEDLIPLLNAYGIKMIAKPYINRPQQQTYIGFDNNNNRIHLTFSISPRVVDDNFGNIAVSIRYKGKDEDLGTIDISTPQGLDETFSLITSALEYLGLDIEGNGKEEEKPKEENDPDVDELIKFKSSLKESELKELEVVYE